MNCQITRIIICFVCQSIWIFISNYNNNRCMTGFEPLILSVYGNGIDLMCTLLSTRPHPLPPVAESRPLSPEIKTVKKNYSCFKKIAFVEKNLRYVSAVRFVLTFSFRFFEKLLLRERSLIMPERGLEREFKHSPKIS